MTDIKQICARLIELWDADCDINVEINELRAALTEPEPEAPTDEELREIWNEGLDTSEEHGAFKFARAVLARWGRHAPAPQPADGEVAELVAWMRNQVTVHEVAQTQWAKRFVRAASLLERLSPPQPVPVSERWPEFSDCDNAERVWCWNLCVGAWRLSRIDQGIHSHWLPAHALPQPS